MIKGVLIGFTIIIILAVIPIVHIAGIPFGPFIGGYYGISSVGDNTGTPARKALMFGMWTGILMGAVLVISATIATVVSEVMPLLIWGGVWVFTFYYASMSGLGAWYAELKGKG
jgi:hypothetical protein